MSTYFKFYCGKCKKSGGFFSRQMWGYGNFDIIESFKFIAQHCDSCGSKNIRVASEDSAKYNLPMQKRSEFLDETSDIFPCSNDWQFMKDLKDGEGCRKKWLEQEKNKLEED